MPALAVAAPAPAPTPAPAAAPAPAATPAPASKPLYTTADTEIGTLLDDPAAKAVLDRLVPGMTTNDQIDMARSMTLKSIQQYAPEQLSDAKLAELDAEFAKLAK
ncbi:MAG: hypothetical protein KGQ75_00185 [Sphingomonadales bacterium]|nr:hypothetical protein [Sphingomonadales bacterium]